MEAREGKEDELPGDDTTADFPSRVSADSEDVEAPAGWPDVSAGTVTVGDNARASGVSGLSLEPISTDKPTNCRQEYVVQYCNHSRPDI